MEKIEIKNKPTKQGLPSYFVVNNEIISNEDEKENENSNDDLSFNFEILGTPPVQKVSHDTLNKSNVNNNQQSLSKKELDETAFIKESILNINAELMAIKSFVMDELYGFNKTLERVRTEQCDQTKLIEEMKNLSNENHTKTLIIKTLSENLNTITKQQNVVNKNLNSNTDQYRNLGNSDFHYPRRSVLISKRSNFTNTTGGISVSPNPYDFCNDFIVDLFTENKEIVIITITLCRQGKYFYVALMSRSSRLEVFVLKGVLKICSKFTTEHPCSSVISFNKVALQFYRNHTSAGVFSWKICCIFSGQLLREPLGGSF